MRNQRIANVIFGASACLFGAAFYVRLHEESLWASIFYFAAQSALIGGAADWFAVTAIFRKPLGFPFHTALIPRSRGRIIWKIRTMMEEKLVRPALWKGLIASFSASAAIRGARKTETGRKVEKRAASALVSLIGKALEDQPIISGSMQERIKGDIEKKLIETVKSSLARRETVERLFPLGLDAGIKLCRVPAVRTAIISALHQWTNSQKTNPLIGMAISMGESMGLIHYEDMADSILEAGENMLCAWKSETDSHYSLRKDKFCQIWESVMHTDAANHSVEQIVQEFVQEFPLEEFLQTVRNAFSSEWDKEGKPAAMEMVSETLQIVLDDPIISEKLDQEVQSLLLSLALYEHAFLGETAETVLQNYDDEKLNYFIESKVGEELGWIRINGSIVAAAVGLVLFGGLMVMKN